MGIASALLAGLLLGAGLTISGMVNPAVVLGFLDVAGAWNPALLIVMASALMVAIPGYWLIAGRRRRLGDELQLPSRTDIDVPLVAGSFIFGIGWGLAGICPGPALAMFAIEPLNALVFVLAMSAGMLGLWFSRR